MTARVLVSIDPGIDRIAAAAWRYDQGGGPINGVGDAVRLGSFLRAVPCTHTASSSDLGARLAKLAAWGDDLSHEVRTLLDIPFGSALMAVGLHDVVIELPTYAGSYKGRSHTHAMADSMGKLHAATGAITAAVSRWTPADHIYMVPAARIDREMKQVIGRQIMHFAQLPNLRDNDDIRSAVYIGAEWLARPLNKPTSARADL